jgi:hypothetical protein
MKNTAIRVEAHDEDATTLAGSLADPIQTSTHRTSQTSYLRRLQPGLDAIYGQRRIPTNLKQRIMKLEPTSLEIV